MQRYFIEAVAQVNDIVQLSEADSRHLLRVMRAKNGEKVIVVANHTPFEAEVIEGESLAHVRLVRELEQASELPVQVTIACGLSKHDKVETIVQKATECGMHEFVPLALKRDIVKWDGKKANQRVERLAKIAKEAAEQSHRTVVPEVQPLSNLRSLLAASSLYDIKLVAYEETAKTGAHTALKQIAQQLQTDQKVLVVFGSEGGLAPEEVAQLLEAGFTPCSLGPRILRAETAPIYLLSALSYQLEL
ncbi:16S rRNA (uracil(1498)-N(3))-methyltransferase [Aerococcaceae bacterium NML190938]|nr:16S rRNA (uracil(1498)-N(3))-methyltransferase [Aerococcaceae bacterium NML190938]